MPSHKNIKKIWVNDDTGRSIFGWKIKEEIFAIFFILVILSLANDENIKDKVSNNIYIQIFIGIVVLYCIYNRIPWSLAFILIFLVALLFSGLLNNVKESVDKIYNDIKEKSKNNDNNTSKDNSLMYLGARVFSWLSKDKISNNSENKKSILKKKVKFENTEPISESDNEENHDEEICTKVSRMFNFSDDECMSEIDTDNETEPDTDKDTEKLKENLKSFMVENMKN